MMMFVQRLVHKGVARVPQCMSEIKIPGKALISPSALSDVSGHHSFIGVTALATVEMSVKF